mmetsp:Transcript_3572/g.4630  ORF Transcript_3572/g.4630 Transcript_3572/m.4630 type:complete len:88 (-) Transcript_3572:69-332(-)
MLTMGDCDLYLKSSIEMFWQYARPRYCSRGQLKSMCFNKASVVHETRSSVTDIRFGVCFINPAMTSSFTPSRKTNCFRKLPMEWQKV